MNAADNPREAEAAVWEVLETRGISRKAIFRGDSVCRPHLRRRMEKGKEDIELTGDLA